MWQVAAALLMKNEMIHNIDNWCWSHHFLQNDTQKSGAWQGNNQQNDSQQNDTQQNDT